MRQWEGELTAPHPIVGEIGFDAEAEEILVGTVNGGIASPSGEGIADIYTALRLNDSCIGRNFRTTVCTGFGDPCDTCTGVRKSPSA